ncbi:ABC transporter ATP-binding protein [Pontibacillus salicampi]|uniref:ABC transporter ATP-binding protein n=1 Tax=Pontibacillus salicampi TaxID=1449801 RepID=A0ABV6LPF9_9BACI
MKTVWQYVIQYRGSVAIAIVLMIIELLVELSQPLVMGIIIDQGIMKGEMEVVGKWGLLLLSLSFLAFVCGIVNSFYAARVSQGTGYDIRRDVFTKIQTFTAAQFQRFPAYSLITRLTNDVTHLQTLVFMILRIMLRAPLFIIGALIMALTVHMKLALILIAAVPVLFGFMLWVLKKGIKLFQEVQTKLDTVNHMVRESLTNMRLIKAYNRAEHEEHQFDEQHLPFIAHNKKALRMLELTMPVTMLGMNVVLMYVLWVGAFDLKAGTAQPGEVVAVLNYGTRVMFSFSVFSFLTSVFSRGKASADRLEELLGEAVDQPPMVQPDEETEMNGELVLDDVSFYYPGNNGPALSEVSLHIPAKYTVGVVGTTGSGKTTLLKLLALLYTPSTGSVLVDHQHVSYANRWALQRQIGLVTQEPHLFSGSIYDNIAFGGEKEVGEVIQAAKSAHIHDFIQSLPEGYHTKVGQKGVNLSGGQKQRISLARALLVKPAILLLDDSTSALDAQTEKHVLASISNLACTTIMVSQKISTIQHADIIFVLENGALDAKGTHGELLRQNKVYQTLYHSQQSREEEGHEVL